MKSRRAFRQSSALTARYRTPLSIPRSGSSGQRSRTHGRIGASARRSSISVAAICPPATDLPNWLPTCTWLALRLSARTSTPCVRCAARLPMHSLKATSARVRLLMSNSFYCPSTKAWSLANPSRAACGTTGCFPCWPPERLNALSPPGPIEAKAQTAASAQAWFRRRRPRRCGGFRIASSRESSASSRANPRTLRHRSTC